LGEPDDAAVWRLNSRQALVATTDFFTPVVDDPYDYGAIAAANALSDVYAMGGQPFLALNIAAIPPDLPSDLVGEILRGGAEKARQAGVVIAGGHTIQDKEPKYGLVVLGFVNPAKLMTKSGAQPGDLLALSKPLGFGVTTTALKNDHAEPEDVKEVVGWMTRLNQGAAELAVSFGVRTATDVTGFSLLGHGWEIAATSGIGLRLEWDKIPFTSGAQRYAEDYNFPGGAYDNRIYFESHVRFTKSLPEDKQLLLFDPQTSGGLLISVPPDKKDALFARAQEIGQELWWIGEVTSGNLIEVV
jgi:selenide,water dikinase